MATVLPRDWRPKGAALRRARPRKSGPNKTELRYWDHLALRKQAGELAWFAYEPIRLRLADKCFFTPDYGLTVPVGPDALVLQLHDVKARWADGRPGKEEDATVKIKTAAELYPMFEFYWAIEGPRGVFTLEYVPPSSTRVRVGGPLGDIPSPPGAM